MILLNEQNYFTGICATRFCCGSDKEILLHNFSSCNILFLCNEEEADICKKLQESLE